MTELYRMITLPETNLSHPRNPRLVGKVRFLFHWWDMLLLMAEILHQLRLIVSPCFSHYLQGFIHPRWLFGISEPSTVCLLANNCWVSKLSDLPSPRMTIFSLLNDKGSLGGLKLQQCPQ